MDGTGKRDAAIYTRQSHGKERSIAEQEAAGRAACEAEGWRVGEVYADRTSASRFATAPRPGWERLLGDLGAGGFGVLVMWESSRGDRSLSSWSALLENCRDRGVLIHVVSHQRTYDIAIPRDWHTLADEGVDSAYESEKTSLRIRRDLAAAAVAGRPHGLVQYGFSRVYDEKTRELLEQREDPGEGDVVREIFGSLDGGVPIAEVTAALNGRGVPAARGGLWTRAQVRQIATNAAYIGKRRSGVRNGGGPILYGTGWWPVIVDEGVFWRVQNRLTSPKRKTTRPGGQKWLLSYLATCAVCGAKLFRTGVYYKCYGHGCVYVRAQWLDGYVEALAVGWLEKYGRAALEPESKDAEAVAARREADRLQAQLDDLARDADGVSARSLAIREADLLPKIAAARNRAGRAALPPALRTAAGAAGVWEHAGIALRREIVEALMTVSVGRAKRPGTAPVPGPERVEITWVYPVARDGGD